MKKLLLVLVFVITHSKSFALYNFTAANDYVQVPSNTSGVVINDILRNDLDGYTGFGFDDFATPVNAAGVSINVLSQSSPFVYLDGRRVIVDFGGPVPDGTYTITYQICRNSNGQCSTTGTVSVKIGGAAIAAPMLSFTDPGCGYTTTVNISGLPAGNWVLNIERSGIWHKALSGSGTSYTTGTTGTVVDLTEGHRYRMSVVDLTTMAVSPFSPMITLPEYTCLYTIAKSANYVDFNNDGVKSIGDRINYTFTATNVVAPNFNINNVEIWDTASLISDTFIPVLAYNTPTVLTAYHELTQQDLDLGVVCVVAMLAGTRSIHEYSQSFTHTYYLPNTPTGTAVLSGDSNTCDGLANLQVAIAGGVAPYTITYTDGTNNFTAMGYTGGNISVLVSQNTTFSLVSVTDFWNNAFENLSGSATVSMGGGGEFTYYQDNDGDGHGSQTSINSCSDTPPSGYASGGGDCDDTDPAVNPGGTEILYNGIDDNCSGQLDEGFQITTSLLPSVCNTTLASMTTLIGITTLAPASAYDAWRIRLTNGNQVQIIEKTVPHFMLSQFPSFAYATTYTVDIELKRNGVWLGYYGPACQITSPAVLASGPALQISPLQCGIALPKINTLIATTSLLGATGYRFRVTNLTPGATGPFVVQTIDRTQHWFSLQMLGQYNYGTTYSVEVAVKTGSGDYGNYGTPCNITSPASPMLANCGATVNSMNSLIATTSLSGVTQYRFLITRQSDGANAAIDRNTNYFTFNMVPSGIFSAGAVYDVRVAVMTSGAWSGFGNVCQIMAPGVSIKPVNADNAIAVKAYPNPFSTSFAVEAQFAGTETVQLKVYDMIGRLVESKEVESGELGEQSLGAHYPTGVYNLIATQGQSVKTIRVIKR